MHRHVQRAGRFIGDDKIRAQGDGNRDQHPLLHSAGKLVRILFHALFRMAQPDFGQQGQHLVFLLSRGDFLANMQDFAHLCADGFNRIQ
ncbi:hypothetical protein D1872_313950 [compost metagenome]